MAQAGNAHCAQGAHSTSPTAFSFLSADNHRISFHAACCGVAKPFGRCHFTAKTSPITPDGGASLQSAPSQDPRREVGGEGSQGEAPNPSDRNNERVIPQGKPPSGHLGYALPGRNTGTGLEGEGGRHAPGQNPPSHDPRGSPNALWSGLTSAWPSGWRGRPGAGRQGPGRHPGPAVY